MNIKWEMWRYFEKCKVLFKYRVTLNGFWNKWKTMSLIQIQHMDHAYSVNHRNCILRWNLISSSCTFDFLIILEIISLTTHCLVMNIICFHLWETYQLNLVAFRFLSFYGSASPNIYVLSFTDGLSLCLWLLNTMCYEA